LTEYHKAGNPLTKRDIIIFIFKWSKGLFGYWFLIIGLSVLVVFTVPQKYEAVAKILIESNRAPVMRADMAFGLEQLSVLNSEVAIIRSNPVFAATAKRIEAINKRKIAKLASREGCAIRFTISLDAPICRSRRGGNVQRQAASKAGPRARGEHGFRSL